MTTVFDYTVTDIHGKPTDLGQYRGKVLLIVNTASKCGFTPQYKGLQMLHERFQGKGLVVLGFPCNQFGHQEPAPNAQIEQFCEMNFGVNFPLFGKIDVNGGDAAPLYKHLKSAAPGILGSEAIKWNFTKFLVDKSGKSVTRYAPTDKPEDLIKDIEALLKA